VQAVAGVTLHVDAGEIVGLVGESGCGKSTLARAVVGLLPASAGSIMFRGRQVTALRRRSRPRQLVGLQMVFQNPYSSLNPRRTIGAQLLDAIAAATGRRHASSQEIADLLERVGLSHGAATRYPHEFSGGQRQRIAVARVLAAKPSVVVLDEPLSSLDASAQAQLANLLVELGRTLGIGLLLISHDLAIVRYVADRVNVMYLGRIVEEGPSELVWNRPAHPYTEALIGAVPHADGMGVLPDALPGEVPDPAAPPSGCRFHPRCPYVFEVCRSDDPRLLRLSSGQSAACWLHSRSPRGAAGRIRPIVAGARTANDAVLSRMAPLSGLTPKQQTHEAEQEETP
jgi:oligopeptide/dipeptide ABC transporter ATP-binding protein